MAATLEAVRQGYPGRRIVLAFQPHRYTRTRDLIDDFAKVLSAADVLLVTEVYAAGEAPIAGADGRAMCRAVRGRGQLEPLFVEKVEELAEALQGRDPGRRPHPRHGRRQHQRRRPYAAGAPAGAAAAREGRVNVAVALTPEFALRVRRDEPLSRHTSWHVGGPAEVFFNPRDLGELAAFLSSMPADVPVTFIGLGSNLLVRDGGIPGVVISTQGTLDALERLSETRVRAGAGVACARIARQCVKWGLGPAEFFAGIPGTLGGALAMNAGAFGGETWEHVLEVHTIDRRGRTRVRERAEYQVSYRQVVMPARGGVVHRRRARLRAQAPRAHTRDLQALLERRRATQPIGEWSCGSVFTNPPGDHAARLIEAAGLKGHRIGGASVSHKHANFIINHGEATCP